MNRVHKIVRSTAAYRQNIRGKNIGIAIVDSGLALHPDYRSRITGWYDTIYGTRRPYDNNGHGSHVAGIAAGNGALSHSLYMGIAPEASLIGVKVLDEKGNGRIADIMRGLDWILNHRDTHRIRIVNISIGANDFEVYHEGSDFVKKVDTLWDAGIVVVAAAGNKGPERYTISAPGNSRKIITVGSSDLWHNMPGQDRRYGSRTPSCPSEPDHPNTHRKKPALSGAGPTPACIKKPDVVAPGSRIISCAPYERPGDGKHYFEKSGTSMSTPIVSGAIALLLSRYPDLTPKEVKIRLKNSGTDLHLPHEKQGWGLLNIEKLLSL